MISQIRESAKIAVGMLQAKAIGGEEPFVVTGDEFLEVLNTSGVPISQYKYDGGFYERNFTLLLGYSGISPALTRSTMQNAVTAEEKADLLFDIQGNRMKLIVWVAYLKAISKKLYEMNHGREEIKPDSMVINFGSLTSGVGYETRWTKAVALMQAIGYSEPDKDDYDYGRRVVENRVTNLTHELRHVKPNGSKSISTLFDKKPGSANASIQDALEIRKQVDAAYEAMPSNALTARTWGWEMEIADAKGVDAVFGVDKGEDGSLRSYESNDGCDCDCNDCTYHDCDCDHCDYRNTDPDHCNNSECSSADSAEFRTKNGSNRMKHAGLFKICKELDEVEAEVNDTCGVHIHVYALDLTTKQVAHVMAVYKWMENIFGIIAERDDVNYARRLPVEYIQQAYAGALPQDKPKAVNLTHLLAGNAAYLESTRGTIEFRQMAGTYDAKRITIWAWIVRGLIEVMKRGAELKDFISVSDINGLIEVYARFNFFLHDENPGLLIPGGQQDKKHIQLQLHKRA